MQLILLAAGRGSRLPMIHRKKPKCLVQINNKTILEYNQKFISKFKKKIIITGYKDKLLRNFAKENDFKVIKNMNYNNTNMVQSLFLSYKFVKESVVVCYGDIIFNHQIYEYLKKDSDIMPVNKNWLKTWKARMPVSEIKKDAENLIIKKNRLLSIGGKIKNKNPKYQYMGIFKLKKKTFFKLKSFYKTLNNKKIDMTNFINKATKAKKLSFKTSVYRSFWFEIDTRRDIQVTSKEIKV